MMSSASRRPRFAAGNWPPLLLVPGSVRAAGHHDELLSQGGRYATLVARDADVEVLASS